MTSLRIAAVQIDYQVVTRTRGGVWLLDEPAIRTADYPDVNSPDFHLSTLAKKYERSQPAVAEECVRAMTESRESYTRNFAQKLREILDFCYQHKVNLVVFPEYSAPVSTLSEVRKYSNRMTIVIGVGYVRQEAIELLGEMDFVNSDILRQGNNVAAVLSPSGAYLVVKKHHVEPEEIEEGSGTDIRTLELVNNDFKIGVSICLDFLNSTESLTKERIDIALIPALTKSTRDFTDVTPRNYVRIFANHAAFGGSYVGIPHIRGIGFSDENGTIPLPDRHEGIVIVDWDLENRWPRKPSRTLATNTRLFARASIVYQGRDVELADGMSRVDRMPSAEVRVDDLVQAGYTGKEPPLSQFIHLAVQGMVQQALEQEVTDYLGRERYQRQPEANGHRNGYKPGRIRSAEGAIAFEVPQVRGTATNYRACLQDDLEACLSLLRCPPLPIQGL